MNTINVVAQFQAICGEYNLNKMVCDTEGHWTANLWKGARRIGTIEYQSPYTAESATEGIRLQWNVNNVVVHVASDEDYRDLQRWADRAGPLGFDSPEDFVMHLLKWSQMLIGMRLLARKGYLVAFPKNTLDFHDMPVFFDHSKNHGASAWISGYAKSHPNMQVVNQFVA
jgi:hypothetical protein